ncbi:MAG: hypothetical protein AMS27_02085 [Bacteroides sp. SM23_62_1]|nr:MAG: hypothetical protein AMS27_02085 [Bacteroides sp. SM23_62_1]
MPGLTKEQIEFIKNDLIKKSLSRSFLFNEYVDHICCDVENLMYKGKSFEDAYKMVSSEIGDSQLKNAQQETLYLLNHKYIIIKKILYLAALFFIISWIINIQGTANWMGLVSFIILSTVYLKLAVDFFRERRYETINILYSVLMFLGFVGTITGIILIFLNRNFGIETSGHGVDFTVFAWFFLSIVCFLYYSREYRTSIDPVAVRKNLRFTRIAGFNLFLSGLSVLTFPLYSLVSGYIFYLITIILVLDILLLIFLLIKRYMNNSLIVAMVMGSFMIVFIHSGFRQKLPGGSPKMHTMTVKVIPENLPEQHTVYLYMYYNRFPEYKITVPMKLSGDSTFTNSWPSYAYKGYLIYLVGKDSLQANRVIMDNRSKLDSIYLDIPKNLEYHINY